MVSDDGPHREALEALLELQKVENGIRRSEKRLDELPEQAALDETLETSDKLKATQDQLRVDRDMVDSKIRSLEGELDMLQQRREKEQTRMYGGEISSPRELQAIRAEIDNVEERIETHEEELLGRMEEREEMTGQMTKLEDRRAQLEVEKEELTAKRDDAAKSILAELGELKARHDQVVQQVPDDLLQRFEKAKERHGAVALGALEGGICTACRLELTPLERSDLRENAPTLGTCPQCQRLLVALD